MIKELTNLGQRALKDSIAIFSQLQHWGSSRHCSRALDVLLVRLQSQSGQRHAEQYAQRAPPSGTTVGGFHTHDYHDTHRNPLRNTQSHKRRPSNEEAAGQYSASRLDNNLTMNTQMNLVDPPIVQPVLEYIGPDFGFDANISPTEGWQQDVPDQDLNFEFTGLFDHAGWNAYMSTLDNDLNL
jgi:hypothetical protein